jgi:hypothetical protein
MNSDCPGGPFGSAFGETTLIIPSYDDELKRHDADSQRLVEDIPRELRPARETLLMSVMESRAEVMTLAATAVTR